MKGEKSNRSFALCSIFIIVTAGMSMILLMDTSTGKTRADDIVANWNFDEGSGQTASDSSGNGNDVQMGTIVGIDSADPTWVEGINGTALRFDGVDDIAVTEKDIGISGDDDRSISLWVKPEHSDIEGQMSLLTWGDTSSRKNLCDLKYSYGSSVFGFHGHYQDLYSNTNCPVNEWYHLAFTYDGSMGKIYLNGELDVQDNLVLETTDTKVSMGLIINEPAGGWNTHFKGIIDEVRIYDRVLSDDEISEYYLSTKPSDDGNPNDQKIAHWQFDEGSGQVVYDTSGNQNDGNVQGATWTEGKSGQALLFDGTNDHVYIPYSTSLGYTIGSDQISVNLWANTPDKDRYETGALFFDRAEENGVNAISLCYGDGEVRLSGWSPSSTGYTIPPATAPPSNQWNMFTVVFTPATVSLFVNGQLESSESLSGVSLTNGRTGFLIGKAQGGYWDSHFNGMIDEVSMFNYALDEDDITLLYNNESIPSNDHYPIISGISRQPSGTIYDGDEVTLSVLASDMDGDTLSYTWTKLSEPMWEASGQTIMIDQLTAGDYTFNAHVSDGFWEVTSSIRFTVENNIGSTPLEILSIVVTPDIEDHLNDTHWMEDRELLAGTDIELFCMASQPLVNYTWTHDQNASWIRYGQSVHVDSDKLEPGKTYTFTCEVRNQKGQTDMYDAERIHVVEEFTGEEKDLKEEDGSNNTMIIILVIVVSLVVLLSIGILIVLLVIKARKKTTDKDVFFKENEDDEVEEKPQQQNSGVETGKLEAGPNKP